MTLSTSLMDNFGDGLREQKELNARTRSKKHKRTALSATSMTDNSGATPYHLTREKREGRKQPTPSPTSLADNPGEPRHHYSVHFRLHNTGFLDIPLGPEQRSKLPESNPPFLHQQTSVWKKNSYPITREVECTA